MRFILQVRLKRMNNKPRPKLDIFNRSVYAHSPIELETRGYETHLYKSFCLPVESLPPNRIRRAAPALWSDADGGTNTAAAAARGLHKPVTGNMFGNTDGVARSVRRTSFRS